MITATALALLAALGGLSPGPRAAAERRGDIAVFPAVGERRVTTYAPPGGSRFLISPCWAAPTTLVTLAEGPPKLLQRRDGDAAPATVRRVPKAVIDASLAPGCGALAELRNSTKSQDVWLRTGDDKPRRVLRTRTSWEDRPELAWTPDARRLAVAPRSHDARLRVINAATGRVVRGFALRTRGGVDDLGAQALSPDGRFVVFTSTTGPDRLVRIADVKTGAVRVLVRGATAAAFSRGGDRIAVLGDGVRIVDLDGRTLQTVTGAKGEHLAWSPDDTRLAVSGFHSEASVSVIDLTAPVPGAELRLDATSSYSSPPVWSPDGAQLAIERTPF